MSKLIDNYIQSRRRKAARRELANLGSYYLADLGIERDQVDVAVEGLLRIGPTDAPASQKRLDWRRLFGLSRWIRYQTVCNSGHEQSV